MVDGPDGAVRGDDRGHYEEGDGHDDQGIFVGEANGEDATGELPVRYSKGIGDPVCYTAYGIPVSGSHPSRGMGCIPTKLKTPHLR